MNKWLLITEWVSFLSPQGFLMVSLPVVCFYFLFEGFIFWAVRQGTMDCVYWKIVLLFFGLFFVSCLLIFDFWFLILLDFGTFWLIILFLGFLFNFDFDFDFNFDLLFNFVFTNDLHFHFDFVFNFDFWFWFVEFDFEFWFWFCLVLVYFGFFSRRTYVAKAVHPPRCILQLIIGSSGETTTEPLK